MIADAPPVVRTPEQGFYDAIMEFVDPQAYDGRSCFRCLIGQVYRAIGQPPPPAWYTDIPPWECFDLSPRCAAIADYFGVDTHAVAAIYDLAADRNYRRDLPSALRMAREQLGLPA